MENGKLYLPIKHLAHLGNRVDYAWNKEINSVILSNDYSEESAYDGKKAGEVLEPLVRDIAGIKTLWGKRWIFAI